MLTTLIIVHVVICVLLTIVVLLQFGKGAEAGAMMGGGGASQAVFTSSAKGNFLTKMTTFLAIAFMVNSIVLTTMKSKSHQQSLFDTETPVAAPLSNEMDIPATPATTEESPLSNEAE